MKDHVDRCLFLGLRNMIEVKWLWLKRLIEIMSGQTAGL
jgi:hypothetical protein